MSYPYLPCKNQNCRSYGHPHPNCKCYGSFAEGGDIHFCSDTRPHVKGCEYFAEGGEAEIPEGFHLVDEDEGAENNDAAPPPTEEAIPEGYHLDESGSSDGIPEGFHLVDDESEHESTTGEKIGATLEGVQRGVLGPLAPLVLEYHPLSQAMKYIPIESIQDFRQKFFSTEGQEALRKENPGLATAGEAAGLVGSLATGTGEMALAEQAAKAMTGSRILQTSIQMGLMKGGDTITDWILGEKNPEDAVGAAQALGSDMLFDSAMGLGFGALGAGVEKGAKAGLKALGEVKFGKQVLSFLEGIAKGAEDVSPEAREAAYKAAKEAGGDMRNFANGVKLADHFVSPGLGTLAVEGGAALHYAKEGYDQDGVWGAATGFAKGAALGWVGANVTSKIGQKYLAPALMKIVSSGTVKGAANALDHVANMVGGSKLIGGAIDGLFETTPIAGKSILDSYGRENAKEDLKNFIGEGGVTQGLQEQIYEDNGADAMPQFAEGGEVKAPPKDAKKIQPILSEDQGIAEHYPTHNVLLNTAKGRVSQYLNGLRPLPHAAKLPFDHEPDQRQQQKSYDKALGIAVSPLRVLHDIKKGTVEPQDVKHLNAMYPELTSLLQKQITERVTKDQLDGKKPPYKVRQGLSLLLGAALSSEMTPGSIAAAQAVFAGPANTQGPQPSGGSQPSRAPSQASMNKLSKSSQAYLTGNQSLIRRSQREN